MTSSAPSPSQLKTAGTLAIVAAVLYLPIFILGIIATISQSTTFQTVANIISFGTLPFYLYPLIVFRRLLTHTLKFTQVNSLINALIGISVAGHIFNLLPSGAFVGILALIMLFVIGIIEIIIGVKLLQVSHKLPSLNAVTYLFIIDGIVLASILLVFLVPLTSLLQYIFLAILLIKAANAKPSLT